MKNIAVILRGHFRTFKYTHKMIFDFYDSIAENVEYYVSTWDTDGQIASRFKYLLESNNKTVIKILEVPAEERYYNSWLGPSWLGYNIIPYKKLREREIKYDAVFDTRPDIMYQLKNKDFYIAPEPMTLYTTRHMITDHAMDSKIRVGVEDWFFMSSSEVHDMMNCRFVETNEIGTHNKILQIATELNLNTVAMPWVECEIIRPNAFLEIPNQTEYFNNKINDRIRFKWIEMTREEKIKILNDNNISLEDFNTVSITAKL